ncbi:MAG: hypothetical protein RLZZ401_1293 [Pseudomonadota bacterium]|jgi:fatty-acyl-CoA synthase
MARAVLIDRLIGEQRPELRTEAQLQALEAVPFAQRVAARSTYAAVQIGAAHNPGAPALLFLPQAHASDEAQTLSYAQLLAQVTQAANLFHSLGVGPGDVVSLMLPLLPASFVALLGAQAAGIANPVNDLLEPHQIADILNAAQTKVLVTLGPAARDGPGAAADQLLWDKVQQIRPQVPSLQTIVVLQGPDDAAQGVYAWNPRLGSQPRDRLVSGRDIAPGDTAAYFHTGGTTGTPKLVRHSHENQVYQAWVCNLMLDGSPGRTQLFGLPLYHVGGALTQGLSAFAGGACVVVLSRLGWRHPNAVRQVWALVDRFKPSVLGAVPTVMAGCLGVPVGGADVRSLRLLSGGGSAIPVAVATAYAERFGLPVLEVYGMTETASVHTISYQDRPLRLGSVGHAVPYSRVRVVRVDAEGQCTGDCATDEIGVVAMSGPGVMHGYLNERHNAQAFVAPGWVNSGDLGRLDADGYLWLTGRAKDLIIRGGHNLDPLPIEDLLYQHPEVALAAVVGQPDAYAGELPLAYVQRKPGASVSAAELLDAVRRKTPERAAVPVEVLLVDAIPLTGVGKVFKPQLRWDAAQRVFVRTLAPLAETLGAQGAALSVSVAADGTHGTLATVRVTGLAPAQRDAVQAQVHALLNPFVTRHAVVWG